MRALDDAGLYSILLKLVFGAPTDAARYQLEELEDLGYIRRDLDDPDRFKPGSLALDRYLRAHSKVVPIWPLLEQTELALRRLVERAYRSRYGDQWIDVIRQRNPPANGKDGTVDRWRNIRADELRDGMTAIDADTSLIQFLYIKDLARLVRQEWTTFEPLLQQDQHAFNNQLSTIIQARNPEAHYRKISRHAAKHVEGVCSDVLSTVERAIELLPADVPSALATG